jgi:pimeloyl-ACP methyl ester carboxylesterase
MMLVPRLRMALCMLVMASIAVWPGTAALAAPAAHAQAGDDCDATQFPSATSQPVSGSVPVLFVHGLDSSPDIWDEVPNSIAVQVAALPGVTAWTYDYSKVAVQWVTDPQIGLGLADAITCLAQASGQKVIVVAHSMGGLATQYAVNQVGTDGVLVANHVAKVITIGTPTKGSLSGAIAVDGVAGIEATVSLLGGLEGKALVAGVEATRSACAGAVIKNPQEDFCSWWGLDETPAGKALLYGSPQLAELPPWPSSVPVVAMAGNFSEDVAVGGISISDVPLGDLIVSLGSAAAYDTSGAPFVVTCPNVTLPDLLLHHDDELCYHHNLPLNPQIDAAVLAQIRASAPATAGSSPSAAPSASPSVPSSSCQSNSNLTPGSPMLPVPATDLVGNLESPQEALWGPEESISELVSGWLGSCVGPGTNVSVTCTPVSATFHPVTEGSNEYYLSGEYSCEATGRSYEDHVNVYVAANGDMSAISTGT